MSIDKNYLSDSNGWAGYNFIGAFGQAFAMVFCCLIILRTHLIYEQWKQTQYRFKNMDSILTYTIHRENSFEKQKDYFSIGSLQVAKLRIYQVIGILILTAFAVGTYLFYFRTDPYLLILIAMFTSLWGIGVFVIVITRRTKEVTLIYNIYILYIPFISKLCIPYSIFLKYNAILLVK